MSLPEKILGAIAMMGLPGAVVAAIASGFLVYWIVSEWLTKQAWFKWKSLPWLPAATGGLVAVSSLIGALVIQAGHAPSGQPLPAVTGDRNAQGNQNLTGDNVASGDQSIIGNQNSIVENYITLQVMPAPPEPSPQTRPDDKARELALRFRGDATLEYHPVFQRTQLAEFSAGKCPEPNCYEVKLRGWLLDRTPPTAWMQVGAVSKNCFGCNIIMFNLPLDVGCWHEIEFDEGIVRFQVENTDLSKGLKLWIGVIEKKPENISHSEAAGDHLPIVSNGCDNESLEKHLARR